MKNRFDISAFVNVLTVQTAMENLAQRFGKDGRRKNFLRKELLSNPE